MIGCVAYAYVQRLTVARGNLKLSMAQEKSKLCGKHKDRYLHAGSGDGVYGNLGAGHDLQVPISASVQPMTGPVQAWAGDPEICTILGSVMAASTQQIENALLAAMFELSTELSYLETYARIALRAVRHSGRWH